MTCLNCNIGAAYQAIDKALLRRQLAFRVRAYRKLSNGARLDTILELIDSLKELELI